MNSIELKRLVSCSDEIIKNWNLIYIKEITTEFNKQVMVLDGIRENFIKLNAYIHHSSKTNKKDDLEELAKFHSSNLLLLQKIYKNLYTKNELKQFTNKFKTEILKELDKLPDSIKCEQNLNVLKTQNGIGSYAVLKTLGTFFYNIKILPILVSNGIAKILKKPTKQLKNRTHTVYFKHIFKGFLLNNYISKLEETSYKIQKRIIQFAHNIFDLEAKIISNDYNIDSFNEKKDEIFDLNNQFVAIENYYSDYKDTFHLLLEKSGTLELPLFYIRIKSNRSLQKSIFIAESTFRLWDSTFYAFYEDWRFREDLFSFVSSVKKSVQIIIDNYQTKLKHILIPNIENRQNFLKQLIDRIPKNDLIELDELKHFFTTEKYKLNKESQLQNINIELFKVKNEIEKLLQKIQLDVISYLEKLTKQSGVVRSPDYNKGIKKTDIYFFSPIEFIEFECLPPFAKNVDKIASDFTSDFDQIINEFSDLEQIYNYTLETALSMANSRNLPKDIVLMSHEGLMRSLNVLNQLKELSNETIESKAQDLDSVLSSFINNVTRLDDNDSILRIYSRLLKAKALKESKDNRARIVRFFSSKLKQLSGLAKNRFKGTMNIYYEIRKTLKLDKAVVYVSSEISNYLSEIDKKIYELPVVYRHLFENTPIKEKNLFQSREKELNILNKAFKDWKSGNYAATLVVGENGVGKSSLLQFYFETVKESLKIRQITINHFYYNESDFYLLMQDVLEKKNLTSYQIILNELNNTSGQLVVVLDGLERLFVRKTGGFNCLNKLLNLIVSTNKHVFWVCSVSKHAYSYLDKTISLKENFDYVVKLENLPSEDIRSIVLKRHRLSGFLLKYEDYSKNNEGKKTEKERQNELELEFFSDLNKFASSNISLSLSYWLESISSFSDKELFIKKFKSPDFSFLETLSFEKIFTLMLIVLHGRITLDLHAQICNQSIEKSSKILTILKEDSILLLKGDYYMLNNILYRHVVQLLKNRNAIH